jgi:hypothetical protein
MCAKQAQARATSTSAARSPPPAPCVPRVYLPCDERLKTKAEGSASLFEEKMEQMLTGFKKTRFHDGQLVGQEFEGEGEGDHGAERVSDISI